MNILTHGASLVCAHELGSVIIVPTQFLVWIEGRPALVDNNPEGAFIIGCPNVGITIKPCSTTLAVQIGYCDFIAINGQRVCLDTVTGLTDGTPPGVVTYKVRSPGQDLVSVK